MSDTPKIDQEDRVFEESFEEHKSAQNLRWAKETDYKTRLLWLEEAILFVNKIKSEQTKKREVRAGERKNLKKDIIPKLKNH